MMNRQTDHSRPETPVPLIVNLSVPVARRPSSHGPPVMGYDPSTETAVFEQDQCPETGREHGGWSYSMTGTLITEQRRDPTADEQTDR